MKKQLWFALLLIFIFASLGGSAALAQTSGNDRDPVVEQEILDRLEQINPQAIPIFIEATEAMDAEDYNLAAEKYMEALELAPDFPDAARRLSYTYSSSENYIAAVEYAELAYRVAPDDPANSAAYAMALVFQGDPAKRTFALDLAKEAVAKTPDDAYAHLSLMFAALANENGELIAKSATKLMELVPDNPLSYYFLGLVAADEGRWQEAEENILLAQKYGMPEEDVNRILNDYNISSNARNMARLKTGGWIMGAWLGGLLLLFLIGALLSSLTLRAVKKYQHEGSFEISQGERILRGFYRGIIVATSLYFYISIPFLLVIIVAAVGGILYFFLQIGRVPVRLTFFLLIGGVYTLYAIVRSVFTKIKDEDPGQRLETKAAPELWRMTKMVAQKLETEPIEDIFISPGSNIGVIERGSFLKKLRGAGQRVLIVGLGVLPNMNLGQFKAILAHEYGHFNSRDTAGGDLGHQVRQSINVMALRLIQNGLAKWYNPAWWFLNGFNRIFLRVTLGASRLQEIIADRYAAVAYGYDNFVDGLSHVVRQSFIFGEQVNQEIDTAFNERRGINNLYTLTAIEDAEKVKQLEEKIEDAMSRQTSPYDSHPAPRDRFAYLEKLQLGKQFTSIEDFDTLMWDLLPAEQLQKEMTANIDDQAKAQRQAHARMVSQARANARKQ